MPDLPPKGSKSLPPTTFTPFPLFQAALAAPKPVWAETPTTHSKDDFTVQRCPYPACHGHRSRKSLAPPLLLLPCSSNPFQRHRAHQKMLAFSSTPPVRKKVDFSTSNPGTPATTMGPSNSGHSNPTPSMRAKKRGNALLPETFCSSSLQNSTTVSLFSVNPPQMENTDLNHKASRDLPNAVLGGSLSYK